MSVFRLINFLGILVLGGWVGFENLTEVQPQKIIHGTVLRYLCSYLESARESTCIGNMSPLACRGISDYVRIQVG